MNDVSTFAPILEFFPELWTTVRPDALRSSVFEEPTVQGICDRSGYSLDPIRRAARLTIFQIFFRPDRP